MTGAEQQDPLIGSTLANNYEILSRIGQGGMSVVYKARQKLIKRTVAVKMLLPQLGLNTQSLQRFRQEAEAASALTHPNVVVVYDFGITQDSQPTPYLVIEYLDGRSLAEVIESEGQLDVERSIRIFVQTCDALAEAHEKGVIHRDLKPSNIMLIKYGGTNDFVKIVDFGIAKVLPGEGENLQKLTQTGDLLGSPLYMSPEQCTGEKLDKRSDIYSLGCLMYETVTGRSPFQGAHTYDTLYKHINEMPPGLGQLSCESRARERLEAIIFKALAKDPAQRYQSMSELRQDLERVSSARETGLFGRLDTQWKLFHRKRSPWKPSRKVVIVLASILVVLVPVACWLVFSFFAPSAIPIQELSWEKPEEQSPPVKQEFRTAHVLSRNLTKNLPDGLEKTNGFVILGDDYKKNGLYDQAEDAYKRAEKSLIASEGADYFGLPPIFIKRADCYYRMGRYEEARSHYDKALRSMSRLSDADNPELAPIFNKLGDIYRLKGKFVDARNNYARSLDVAKKTMVAATPEYALTIDKLGDLYRLEAEEKKSHNEGKAASVSYAEAGKYYTLAVEEWEKFAGKDERGLGVSLYYLAYVDQQLGKWGEARQYYGRALAILKKALGPEDPFLATLLSNYSEVLWHTGSWFESIDKSRQARFILAREK